MENDPKNTTGVARILKGIGLALSAVVALSVAIWAMPGTWRSGLLQLAGRAGVYQEAEHEMVAVQDEEGRVLHWTCTMHAWVRAEGPGKCPV